jgi:outer membrane protein assembly factor BamB
MSDEEASQAASAPGGAAFCIPAGNPGRVGDLKLPNIGLQFTDSVVLPADVFPHPAPTSLANPKFEISNRRPAMTVTELTGCGVLPRRATVIAWALLSLFISADGVTAADWPEFRGPTGQGHAQASGLPVHWDTSENVAWKAAIPGAGWSSPVVSQGRVYLTTAVPKNTGNENDQSLRTLCLDVQTGGILWNIEVFDQDGATTEKIHDKNSHASATPIVDGRFVFVHFGTQGTACLTLDGEIVWATRELKYQPRHGNGGSPALIDDLLVIACDGLDVQFVVALDRKTGEIRWKTDRPVERPQKFSFSTPLVIEVDGRKQVVCPGTDLVAAYDPRDGREIWKFRYSGYSVIPRPVFGNGLLFIATGYNTPSLFAIRPDGRGDVTGSHEQWALKRAIPHTPSVLLIGDELYFVSDRGIASCVDSQTGELHWQERVGGTFSASPVTADGKIYLQSEQGVTHVIRPGKTYRQLARNDLQERTLASPAVIDAALLIRTEAHLYRIDGK